MDLLDEAGIEYEVIPGVKLILSEQRRRLKGSVYPAGCEPDCNFDADGGADTCSGERAH